VKRRLRTSYRSVLVVVGHKCRTRFVDTSNEMNQPNQGAAAPIVIYVPARDSLGIGEPVPSRAELINVGRHRARTLIRSVALIAAFLLAGWVGAAGAVAEFSVKSAGTNAPEPLTLDFEPNLPLVVVEAKGAINHAQGVPCIISLLTPKGVGVGKSNSIPWTGTMKIHGGVSQGYPKKSYSLTLATPAKLLDLRESAHWLLNAAFIDRSLMRHKLSYDLFRSLNSKSAARLAVASRFVEVYLNSDYKGAYLLMERTDRQLFQMHPFRSNEVSHACIYKAIDHSANFGQPWHAGYEQREPDPLVNPYWQPLDEFDRFVSSSSDQEFFDPQTGIASRLDLDNAIDFHLLVLLTSNLDGITKNFIIARNAPGDGLANTRFFFSPWDYDGTFGRNWDASEVGPTEWLSNHLFDRLMRDHAYRERFAKRWKELREREFSTATIRGMIEANAHTLGEAARRNATRWRDASGYYPDRLAFAEDVSQMKTWIEARLHWLDGEIQRRNLSSQ